MEKVENRIPQLEQCECNEVKVGDKLKIYHRSGFINGECKVQQIDKLYDGFSNKPIVDVMIEFNWIDFDAKQHFDAMRLRHFLGADFAVFNLTTMKRINGLTFKDEK